MMWIFFLSLQSLNIKEIIQLLNPEINLVSKTQKVIKLNIDY